ncbi:MAG: hypothetical protein ITG02_05100 [Patulibacter sp.]|nr:hypothetical protein [Patulibacter sp.]
MTSPCLLVELRCNWSWRRCRVVLDAELVTEPVEDGVPTGVATSELLAVGVECPSTGRPDPYLWLAANSASGPRLEAEWPNAPRHLPGDEPTRIWADLVGSWLAEGVGEQQLTQLLTGARRGDHHLRIVCRADDRMTAVPFETATWPSTRGGPLVSAGVSIVRTADLLTPPAARSRPPLGARDPGVYRAALAYFGRAGDGREFAANLTDAMKGLPISAALPVLSELEEIATNRHDLLVVGGHGGTGGIDDGGRGWIDADQLVEGVRSAVPVVIVASCGSAYADPWDEGRRSLVAALARQGHGIVAGFQGESIGLHHAQPWLTSLVEKMQGPLAAERRDHRITLWEWERALTAARAEIPGAASVPVTYVHPATLAGRPAVRAESLARSTPAKRKSGRSSADQPNADAVATPWYVPGQVSWVLDDGRPLRLPLPVDIGARLSVTAHEKAPHRLVSGSTLTLDDLDELVAAWGLEDVGLTVELHPGAWERGRSVRTRGWARRSAELSALARAIAAMAPTAPGAGGVVARLAHEAALDGGAIDAAPRLMTIGVSTSVETILRWDRWPAVVVRAAGPIEPRAGHKQSFAARFDDSAHALVPPGATVERLESALESPSGLLGLVRAQTEHLTTTGAAALPANLWAGIDAAPNPDLVAVPGLALLRETDTAGRDGRVHVEGVEPALSDPTVSDECDW